MALGPDIDGHPSMAALLSPEHHLDMHLGRTKTGKIIFVNRLSGTQMLYPISFDFGAFELTVSAT